jgi:hypothetical protein
VVIDTSSTDGKYLNDSAQLQRKQGLFYTFKEQFNKFCKELIADKQIYTCLASQLQSQDEYKQRQK